MKSEFNETVRKLREMDWESMYEDENSGLEEVMPSFSDLIKVLPYRYEWVINHIKGLNKNDLNILVIGSQTGALEYFLKLEGYDKLTSIEVEDKTIARIKERIRGLNIFKGFIESLPLEDNRFDVVITTQVLEHLIDPIVAIKEMKRVLKEGGLMLNTVPKDGLILSDMHKHKFDLYKITELFNNIGDDFSVVEIHKHNKALRYTKPNLFAVKFIKGIY